MRTPALCLLLALLPAASFAGSITCYWSGAAGDGKWTTSGNWNNCSSSSPGQTYPADTVRVSLTSGNSVTLDSSVTIGGASSASALSLASGSRLDLAPGPGGSSTTLTLMSPGGPASLSNTGIINLPSSTSIVLAGDTANKSYNEGGGTITMSGGSIVQGGSTGMTFQNNGTLQGYGSLGADTNLTLANYFGTIKANSAGNTLTIDPAGNRTGPAFVSTGGVLQAGESGSTVAGATLRLVNGRFEGASGQVSYLRTYSGATTSIENSDLIDMSIGVSGGELRLANSTITLSGAYTTGLSVSSGGTINAVSGTNSITRGNGSNFSNDGTITATNGATLAIAASSFTNSGSFSPNGGTIILNNSTINNGTFDTTAGVIQLNGSSIAHPNSAALSVTNGPGGGIVNMSGSSSITAGGTNVSFSNTGVIRSQGGSLTLTGNSSTVNDGTFQASGGSLILASNWLNVGNTVADAGSSVVLNGAKINSGAAPTGGGTITVNPGATLAVSGTSSINNSLNIVQNGTLVVNSGATLQIQGAGMTLNQAAGAVTTINGTVQPMTGNFTLNGGTVTIASGGRVYTTSGGTFNTNAYVTINGGIGLGYTVDGGSMTLNGAIGSSTTGVAFTQNAGSTVAINSGGKLYGAAVTENGNLVVNPGGSLNASSYALNAGVLLVNGSSSVTGVFNEAAGAILNVGGSMTVNSTFNERGNVRVFSGGTMNTRTYYGYSGDLMVDGTLTPNGTFYQQGANVTVDGSLNPTQFSHSSGDLTVTGTLKPTTTSSSGSTTPFTQSSGNVLVTSTGLLDITSARGTGVGYSQTGGTVQLDGTLTMGTRSISISGGTLNGSGTLNGAVSVTNTGVLTGSPTINGAVSVSNGGRLTGTPDINGNLSIGNRGALAIGNSPGRLDVTGNYTQLAGSIWEVDLWGPDPGTGYDQLNVTGDVALAGTLRLNLTYDPSLPTVFQILTYTGVLTGDWTSVEFDYSGIWSLKRDPGAISLQLGSDVPEPATFALVAMALLSLGLRARRKSWLRQASKSAGVFLGGRL